MICPKCKEDNLDDSLFCCRCGRRLLKKKNKRKFIIVFIILCVFGSIFQYNHIKQQEEKEYESLFLETTILILSEEILSASMCEEISKIWNKAIDNNKDFNQYLVKLNETWETNGELGKRRQAKSKIEQNMKKLKDYPKSYEEAYRLQLDLYDSYGRIYSQATNPSGSLVTYNKDVGDKISEFDKIYDRLVIIKPNIKSTQKK